MKLIINIKCYCEFVICFYFCSGLTEHKNERKRKRQDFYSMAVVNDAYAIFHEGVSKCTPSVFYTQSPDFHKLGLCYYLKILYL